MTHIEMFCHNISVLQSSYCESIVETQSPSSVSNTVYYKTVFHKSLIKCSSIVKNIIQDTKSKLKI